MERKLVNTMLQAQGVRTDAQVARIEVEKNRIQRYGVVIENLYAIHTLRLCACDEVDDSVLVQIVPNRFNYRVQIFIILFFKLFHLSELEADLVQKVVMLVSTA